MSRCRIDTGDDFFLRGGAVTRDISELVDMSIVGSVLSVCTEPLYGATLAKVIALGHWIL